MFKDAGANLFGDLMNGTKPLAALKNFANAIGKQINDTVAKDLSNQVFGKGGIFGGAGGSWRTCLAARTARQRSSPMRRTLRKRLSAAPSIAAGNPQAPKRLRSKPRRRHPLRLRVRSMSSIPRQGRRRRR
jgi:hypothetical protein